MLSASCRKEESFMNEGHRKKERKNMRSTFKAREVTISTNSKLWITKNSIAFTTLAAVANVGTSASAGLCSMQALQFTKVSQLAWELKTFVDVS